MVAAVILLLRRSILLLVLLCFRLSLSNCCSHPIHVCSRLNVRSHCVYILHTKKARTSRSTTSIANDRKYTVNFPFCCRFDLFLLCERWWCVLVYETTMIIVANVSKENRINISLHIEYILHVSHTHTRYNM